MDYLLFLVYYLITSLVLLLIIMLVYHLYFKRKVKKISLDNEKILEDFFNKL